MKFFGTLTLLAVSSIAGVASADAVCPLETATVVFEEIANVKAFAINEPEYDPVLETKIANIVKQNCNFTDTPPQGDVFFAKYEIDGDIIYGRLTTEGKIVISFDIKDFDKIF